MIDIHVPTMEIPEDSPFKYDRLNRITDVVKFKKLLSNLNSGVICLNAPWGEGKTTFVRLLQTYMDHNQREELHIKTIYYNAWEHDYEGNPFPSIVRTILKELDDPKAPKLKENLIESAKSILKTMYIFSSFAAYAVDPMLGGVVSTGKAALDNFLSEVLPDSSKPSDTITEFRKNIQNILHSENENVPTRIVLFIDELDRCRPSFAIETLEQIKHIFETENMIFVLSLDKEQLANAIGTIYGANYNANGYLSRFFDLEYCLNNSHAFHNRIMEIGGSLSGVIERAMDHLSLREKLRILKRVELSSHLYISDPHYEFSELRPYILFYMTLRYITPKNYQICLHDGIITEKTFYDILNSLTAHINDWDDYELIEYIKALSFCLSQFEYGAILGGLDPSSRLYDVLSKLEKCAAKNQALALRNRNIIYELVELSGTYDFDL